MNSNPQGAKERVLQVWPEAHAIALADGDRAIHSGTDFWLCPCGSWDAALFNMQNQPTRLPTSGAPVAPPSVEPQKDDEYFCSFTVSGEHAPSAMGDCIYCGGKGRPHKMRSPVAPPVAPESYRPICGQCHNDLIDCCCNDGEDHTHDR